MHSSSKCRLQTTAVNWIFVLYDEQVETILKRKKKNMLLSAKRERVYCSNQSMSTATVRHLWKLLWIPPPPILLVAIFKLGQFSIHFTFLDGFPYFTMGNCCRCPRSSRAIFQYKNQPWFQVRHTLALQQFKSPATRLPTTSTQNEFFQNCK